MTLLIKSMLGVVPILLFLSVLCYMDSFRLVRVRAIMVAIGIGCGIAVICMLLNQWLLDFTGVTTTLYTRYGGPLVEETLKAGYLVFLIRSQRVDFLIDSAICGFAVGAGFAVVENIYYLTSLTDPHLLVWVIRGFGTAGIHGTATAVFGLLAVSLLQKRAHSNWHLFVPPLAVAVLLHSLFNHFILSPVAATIWLVVLLPLLVVLVYERSEKSIRRWLGLGLDTEIQLLQQITSDRLGETRLGRYLQTLRDRFPGEVVGDMLCFLQIHLELSIGAKGIMLMKGAGLKLPRDPEIRAKLNELQFLEKSLGKTGRLALKPFLRMTRRELWQLYMLDRLKT